jgi:hypothetical protein
MSNITSTITPDTLITSTVSSPITVSVSTFSEGGRTLSELTDVDLQGVTSGSILIYDTNEFVSRALTGDVTINSSGVTTISPNSVTLGSDTTGQYVSTIVGTSDQVIVGGSGVESAAVTLSLPQSIAPTSSPTFNNITLSGSITNADLTAKLNAKAPSHSPTFTGTVSGITKEMVGLSAVDNTSDLNKPISTAIQSALNTKVNVIVGKALSDENYTAIEKTKLAGIANGATANSTDAYLLDRANHTGSQSYTTITGLGTLATQSGTFSGTSSGTNTGDQTITLGGDASGSGTGLLNVTLSSTGVFAGTYNNSATVVSPLTIDVKGRITAVGNPITISPHWNSVTNKPTTLSGYGISDAVDLSSSQTISGHKDFTSSPTVPLIPTASGHAASKAYVDTLSEGLHVHAATHAIITGPLSQYLDDGTYVIYSNGTNGVGAKLTVSAPVTWTTVFNDSDIIVGSRVIIAGQSTSAHNGIYVVSSSTELTRADDFNTPTEMAGGDFVFVTHGTYADTGWVLSEPVTEVGATAVIFTQFSGAGTYEAGSGLSRDGTTFSVKSAGIDRIIVDVLGVDLARTGISTGTYRSVTVDSYGRVTAGSNPTTLNGYGITDAASSTALSNHISDATVHLTSTQNTLLDGITVTSEKVNYLSNVTSNIQSQLDGKSASGHTHSAATTSVAGFLSASDKSKLDGIAAGAEVNVNADWSAASGDTQILNKPTTLSGYGITDAVNLTGTQTITGTKTINAPVTMNSNFLTIQSDALNPSYGLKIANTNSFDPGTPLLVDGRARFVHGVSFAAGITNFTNNSDHTHVQWTAQGRGNWQMIQNGGTSSTNRNTFLLTTVGSTASQTFFNESNAYNVDTTGVVASSVSPFIATGIKVNYNTAGSGLAIGDYVQITFNPGAAGVVANTYPGVVTAGPTAVTIAGTTKHQYTFSLENFSSVNWVAASARAELIYLNSSSVNNVRVSYAPTQIDGTRVSLTGNYSGIGRYVLVNITGHTAFEGQSAVLVINTTSKIGLAVGSYNCFVKRVIGSNSFVISVGNAINGWSSTSGSTGSAGWILYKGSTDAVHQYTPALQHFYYQRFPTSDTSPTTTGGNRNVALGNSAEVDGDFSYSLGHKSAVYGAHSVALGGEDSFVTGNYSTTLGGQGLVSSGAYQTIIGKYNTIDSSNTKPFIVGWGSSDSSRSNLLELSNTTLTLNTAINASGSATASSFIRLGGTSSQFLKADGSVDSNTYSVSGHTHVTSQITDLYQPSPQQDPDATSNITVGGTLYIKTGAQYYEESGNNNNWLNYNSSINRWQLGDNVDGVYATSTSDGFYPWLATWSGYSVEKYSYPRIVGALLASMASDGVSNYAARADHVHPLPSALQVGAAPLVGGKIPIEYIPSASDDVLVFNSRANFPVTGETGKVYIALNETYFNNIYYEAERMYVWQDASFPSRYIECAPLSDLNPSNSQASFIANISGNSVLFRPSGLTGDRNQYKSILNETYTFYNTGRWKIISYGEETYTEAEANLGTELYPWQATWPSTSVSRYPVSYNSNAIPRPLSSVASSGTSGRSARADHVHPLPTAAEVGATTENFAIAMAIALG